jgi:hypothetical protein
MKRKRGELWRDHLLILHHDNPQTHPSLRVPQFLAGKGISAMDHPPYFPDLPPADFGLIPELNSVLKGKRSSDVRTLNHP